MNPAIYDNQALEDLVKNHFGQNLDVESVIIRNVPLSRTTMATVWLTKKKQLFVLITAQSSLTFGDVKKLVAHMGLKPEVFLPPKGRPTYFDDIGRAHFRNVFPGRAHITSDDLVYYRTLAPYNPALLQISEVLGGEIRQFDPDSHGGWRTATKFTYRRIKTS